MKNLVKFIMLGIIISLIACDQDDEAAALTDPLTPPEQTLSQEVEEQIEVNTRLDKVRSLGLGAPGGIIKEQPEFLNGRQQKTSSWRRMHRLMNNTRVAEDSICVAQIFILNDDGSFVWVIDFGEDGCEIDGEFWKGKVVETYHENDEEMTFSAAIAFENFGQADWTLNGIGFLEGSYHFDSLDGFFTEYNFARDLELMDENEQWTVEQVGREHLSDSAWTVMEMASNVEYFNSEIEETDIYQNLVLEPLVIDFTCEELGVFTFVQGIEQVRYNDEEATVLFGEGECDNIITIAQEGIVIIIDLDEIEDDDDDDDMLG